MFAPPLYIIRKFPLKFIVENNYNIKINREDEEIYKVKEQDNQLFRQIRLITNGDGISVKLGKRNKNKESKTINYNKYIVFVNCKNGGKNKNEKLTELILNGFNINNQKFVFSERSASMTRNSILSFVDETIAKQLDEIVGMGIDVGKTVLSKYYAYRGLLMSSCHCIENWYPKIVIVPDHYRIIKNQHIKYLYDKETEFIDKDGNKRIWNQKDVAEGIKDIEINAFDGCGIHHPKITEFIQNSLKSKTSPTSIQWRLPFIKGLTHEVNYVEFYKDNGIVEIEDLWGVKYGVRDTDEPLIIMTESMYKGLKYFKNTNTTIDWDEYWKRFKKYNHCIGISKWNYSLEEEPIYTRANYQILQDLDLPYEEFRKLADYSLDWVQKIIDNDVTSVYASMGIFADKCKPLDVRMKAVLKNPEMLKEKGVREYLVNIWKTKIDEMKCGKLYVKGAFKFAAPDLIMLMQHVAGLETNGCLEFDEMFTQNIDGVWNGDTILERNPHISESEHIILKCTDNELRKKYCPNLFNVCMINCKSITAQKANGQDFDGDLDYLSQSSILMDGINRDLPSTIDIEDKMTTESEYDTIENKLKVTLRTMVNMIGEYSNYSSAYHNKTTKTIEQKIKYNNYISIISVATGKVIDFAKTGVLYKIPRNIAKYGRPLPYFMKYRSEYYAKQKLSKTYSNMNKLCWEIEKWERNFKWKRTYKDFDYKIMMDDLIDVDQEIFDKIDILYIEFMKKWQELKKEQSQERLKIKNYKVNWEYYINKYKKKCNKICPNKKMLANIAVTLSYEKYKSKKNTTFIWKIASEGILENLPKSKIKLPLRDNDGDFEYLGKKYILSDIINQNNCDNSIELEWEEFD